MLAQRKRDVLEDGHRIEQRAALEEHAEFLAHAIHGMLRGCSALRTLIDQICRVSVFGSTESRQANPEQPEFREIEEPNLTVLMSAGDRKAY